MRYFIALEIPEEAKKQLKEIQEGVKKIIPDSRLTDNAARDIPPFILTPGYIDGFPTLHHPHIIWVGVKEDVDKLFLLRERIKDGLEDLQLEVDERRYTPHIAIAKIRGNFSLNQATEDALQ